MPAPPAGAQPQQQRMPPSRRELLAQPQYPRNTSSAAPERPVAAGNNDRAGRVPVAVVVSAPLVRELEAALAASPWGYTPHTPPTLPMQLPYGEADAGPALEDVVRRYPAAGGKPLILKSREREVEPADAEMRARVAVAVCAVVDYAATRAAPATLDDPQACVLCLEAMASTKRSSEHFWARYMTEGRLHPVGAGQALLVYIHLFDASVFPEVDMRLVEKLSSEAVRPWQPIQLAYLIPVARAVARFRGLDADWADTLANAVDAQVRSPAVLGKALSQLAATPAIVGGRLRASLARAAARHAAHVARDQLQPLVCNLADCGVPLDPPTRDKLAARAAETADAWPHEQRARMLESLVRLRIPVAPAQIEQTVVAALESLLAAGRTRDVLVVVLSLSELAAACDRDSSAAVDVAIVDALTAILPQLTSVEVIELAVRNAARPLKPLSALLAPHIEDAALQLTSAQAAAAIYALATRAATDVTRNDDAPTPLSDALVAACNRVAEQMTPADVARAYAGVTQIAPSQADHLLQLLRARVVLLDAESVAVAWTSIHALREWEAYTYRDLAAQTRVLLEPATFRTIQHASPHAVSTTLVAFASLRSPPDRSVLAEVVEHVQRVAELLDPSDAAETLRALDKCKVRVSQELRRQLFSAFVRTNASMTPGEFATAALFVPRVLGTLDALRPHMQDTARALLPRMPARALANAYSGLAAATCRITGIQTVTELLTAVAARARAPPRVAGVSAATGGGTAPSTTFNGVEISAMLAALVKLEVVLDGDTRKAVSENLCATLPTMEPGMVSKTLGSCALLRLPLTGTLHETFTHAIAGVLPNCGVRELVTMLHAYAGYEAADIEHGAFAVDAAFQHACKLQGDMAIGGTRSVRATASNVMQLPLSDKPCALALPHRLAWPYRQHGCAVELAQQHVLQDAL